MGYERQADLGTPEVVSETQVTLTIDGRAVSVPAGTSVMRAAALAGGSIPKLCASDNLAAFGSCRLCLVEIEGARGTKVTYQSSRKANAPANAPRTSDARRLLNDNGDPERSEPPKDTRDLGDLEI